MKRCLPERSVLSWAALRIRKTFPPHFRSRERLRRGSSERNYQPGHFHFTLSELKQSSEKGCLLARPSQLSSLGNKSDAGHSVQERSKTVALV